MRVTHPEHALFFGTARSLHGEDPTVMVMALDVESGTGAPGLAAIGAALMHLTSVHTLENVDYEFVERDGMIYISRIIPEKLINQSESDSTFGPELKVQSLHSHPSTVRLISTRTGTLDSLQYAEIPTDVLEERDVEIEIHAAALNFKVSFVSDERSLPISDILRPAGSRQCHGVRCIQRTPARTRMYRRRNTGHARRDQGLRWRPCASCS
jgi:hypothetical protein